MRRLLLVGAAMTAIAISSMPSAHAAREVQPVERVAAIARPAVVYLEISWKGWLRDKRDGLLWLKDPIETGGTCSGSVINPDGYVLTAGHCVEPDLQFSYLVDGVVDAYIARGDVTEDKRESFTQEVTDNSVAEGPGKEDAPLVPEIKVFKGVTNSAGQRVGKSYKAEVVDWLSFEKEKGDTAILKLDGASGLSSIELSDETDIGVGTPLVAIGYPGSVSRIIDVTLEPTNKDGTVSAQRTQNGVPFYEISAASTPGMSGGPVVDLDGKVIGIVSQSPSRETQSFNLIVSASVAHQLLTKNHIANNLGPTDEAYREGLQHLFDGKFKAAAESFDEVLKSDPRHQQAYEFKQVAVKREATEGESGGLPPWLALVPLALAGGGLGFARREHRRHKTDVAAPSAVATPTPQAPDAAAAPAAGDVTTCDKCGHEHARPVAFCTRCGNPMTAGAARFSELQQPATPVPEPVAPVPLAPAPRSQRVRLITIASLSAFGLAVVIFLVAMLGAGPSVSPLATSAPTPVGERSQAGGPVSIDGKWSSEYGPVTLKHDEVDESLDPVDVSGSWIQGEGKKGKITSGTFDPKTGELEIAYVEEWTKNKGTASFVLSDDGKTLAGTYEQANGHGNWTLERS